MNFDDWRESLDMYLTITKEDLAMREPKPANLTPKCRSSHRAYHKQWYELNRICLIVIKYTIEKTIMQSIPEKETAVEYLKAVSEKYKKSNKAQKSYYLSLLENTHYDGVSCICKHIMKLAQLLYQTEILQCRIRKESPSVLSFAVSFS